MSDYSLPRIKESALPEATNVDKVRVLDSTGKSVWVEKEDLPITETQVTGLTDDLALKADKSVEIIAGAGLTGGGDLSAARTFNVVSADDGITVNANDIKLNIVNNLTTSSATRALSATQGKKLQDEKEALANKSTDIVADAESTTKYPSVKLIKDYADSLVVGLLDYRGGFDASVNAYPSSGGSGTGGAILKGDMWVVSVAGTIDGHAIHAGDSLIANDDTPGQTTAKWNTVQSNLSYVPEDVANKSTNVTSDAASDTKYPSVKAVKTYADSKVSLTGNETIEDVKTFSSSPIVPTPTGDTDAVNKAYVTSALTDALPVAQAELHPELAFYTRWLADTGTQLDEELLLKVYADYLNNLPETEFLFCPQIASKNRTDGVNQYINTMYDLGEEENDAVQTTEATQPFMTINAAPNGRKGIRFVQGQTQTGLMDFDDVAFAAGDSWTLTIRLKINKKRDAIIYLSAGRFIEFAPTVFFLNNGSVNTLGVTYNFECGKTYTIECQYSNGAGLIVVNSIPQVTAVNSGAMVFGQFSYVASYPLDCVLYAFHLTNTRKSAYQSQLDHTFLSTLFPDMESVAIGNQVWTTENFCGTVAGDGTVIPEVQPSTPTEIISGGDFEGGLIGTLDNSSGGATVTWTLNTSSPIAGTQDGRLVCSAAGTNSDRPLVSFPVNVVTGKRYVFKMAYKLNSGMFILQRVLLGAVSAEAFSAGMSLTGSGTMCFQFVANATGTVNMVVNPRGTNLFDVQFDAVSLSELSASDSTVIYNAVYAQTSGSAAVKDLAATKAAAMWCHYDNSAANGAVYGKHFNGYSVKLLDKYPLRGYRIPSYASVVQLVTLCGSPTIAAKKLKATGVTYWASGNTGTNEAGFSAIASGVRGADGTFADAGNKFVMWTSDGYLVTFDYNADTVTYTSGADPIIGASIRLLRNSPAGDNELSYTSGLFTTDITSAAKQIAVSFGRSIDYIRIKSENALTAVEAKLHNSAGTAVATLITGKSVSAGATMVFPVSADYAALLQDGTVRVTASGNSGAAVGMEIEVLTHKSVL